MIQNIIIYEREQRFSHYLLNSITQLQIMFDIPVFTFFYEKNPQMKRFGKIRCCYGDIIRLKNCIKAPVRLTAAAGPGRGRGAAPGKNRVSQRC